MYQNEKIEILMATYNGEKYIKEQINSIINQTYINWRLLIRDDGSKDKTVEIIKEYEKKDDRIKLLEDNKGNLGFIKNLLSFLIKMRIDWKSKIEKYVKLLKVLDKEILKKPLLMYSNSFVCDKKLYDNYFYLKFRIFR